MKTVNIRKRFFEPKVQTVGSISDFLGGISATASNMKPYLLAGVGAALMNQQVAMPIISQIQQEAVPVMAGLPVLGAVGITNQIIHAFDPLIQLMQGLGYPVGYVMLTAGALVWMAGNRPKGMMIIKSAAIGYLILQLAPGIMEILVGVGEAMKGK